MVNVVCMNMTPAVIVLVLTNLNCCDDGNYQNNNTVVIYTYSSPFY